MLGDTIRYVMGEVAVREDKNIIYVEGLRSYVLSRDIYKRFRTSRLFSNIIKDNRMHSFSFFSFFALDMYHLLEELVKNPTITSKASIVKIMEQMLENTWLRNTQLNFKTKLNRSKLDKFYFKPLNYQTEFYNNYDQKTQQYDLNGYLANMAAGSGKTYTSITLAEMLENDVTIIVCPLPALNRVWKDSFNSLYKVPPKVWYSDSNDKVKEGFSFYVVHYDYLEKFEREIKLFERKTTTVILDESHNFNDKKSLRTQLFINMCKSLKSKDVIYLSGTPFKAMTMELIPMLKVIDPMFNIYVEQRFKDAFKGNNEDILKLVSRRIGSLSFKVEKEALKLLDPEFSTIEVSLKDGYKYTLSYIRNKMELYIKDRILYYQKRRKEDEQEYVKCLSLFEETLKSSDKKDYETYKRNVNILTTRNSYFGITDIVEYCNKYEKNVIIPNLPEEKRKPFKELKTIIKYTRLKIVGECLANVLGSARIQCHVDMAKEVDLVPIIESSEKKTVIFTTNIEVGVTIVNNLIKQEYKPVAIFGEHTKQLSELVKKFNEVPNANPMVATYLSMSTAVPLTVADRVVLFDVPFRDYILTQAVSRVHRLGADTQIKVFYTKLNTGEEPNVSTRNLEILNWAADQVAMMLDIDRTFVLNEEDNKMENIIDTKLMSTSKLPLITKW